MDNDGVFRSFLMKLRPQQHKEVFLQLSIQLVLKIGWVLDKLGKIVGFRRYNNPGLTASDGLWWQNETFTYL